jgi:HTH-type transcriptional regulator / antitoxin HipB
VDYPIRLTDQLRVHLRALRKQRGLTQVQLGQKLGIGQVRVSEIEARPGLVSVDQLFKLMSALGVILVLRDLMDSTAAPAAQAEVATARPPARGMSTAPPAKPAQARGGKTNTASSTRASTTGDKRPTPPGPPMARKSNAGRALEDTPRLRICPRKGSW